MRLLSRHTHDDGELIRRTGYYEYVRHLESGEPGLLAVVAFLLKPGSRVNEYWFDEDTGFAPGRALEKLAPAGRVVTVDWVEVQAA